MPAMTSEAGREEGPWIDETIGTAFDSIGLERCPSTSSHLYARLPIREPAASALLVEPTSRGLEMEVLLGPLSNADGAQLRQLSGVWRDRRSPISLEAMYLPGGLHVRATAVYGWPRRSRDARANQRMVTIRIEDFVQDVSRLARALVRPQLVRAVGDSERSTPFQMDTRPQFEHPAPIASVTWKAPDELWVGAADGALLKFVRSIEGTLDVATGVQENGEIVALAYDTNSGRTAVGTSRGLVVIEADSSHVQLQTSAYVTDVDWDLTSGDLIAALDFGRLSPGAIDGLLPIWDSRPVAIWTADSIRENAEPTASLEPEDYGAQCVASAGHGIVAVGTTMWESGRVDLFRTSDLAQDSAHGGRFLSNWGSVDSLAWHPECGLAVEDNGWVVVWRPPVDLFSGCDELAYLGYRSVSSLAWAADGHLAVGTYDGFILVWERGNVGNDNAPAFEAKLQSPVTDLAWSPDGVLAVASVDGNLRLVRYLA